MTDRLPPVVEDDDPYCVCGTARSEHHLLGCREGFQTADQWAAEKAFIESLSDWEYERMYGDSADAWF